MRSVGSVSADVHFQVPMILLHFMNCCMHAAEPEGHPHAAKRIQRSAARPAHGDRRALYCCEGAVVMALLQGRCCKGAVRSCLVVVRADEHRHGG